jgi:hypothetical protein
MILPFDFTGTFGQFHLETGQSNKAINPEDPAVPSEMPISFYFTGVNPV